MEKQNMDEIDSQILDIFFEKSPFALQSLNESGHIINVSSAWLDILGYSKKYVIGKSFRDFLSDNYKDHFKECFPKFKEMGQISDVEFEIKKKNGDIIFVSFNGKIIHDSKGKFKQTLCFMQDISNRKAIEKELSESENKYREIIEQSPDSIVTFDLKGFVTSCNAAHEKFTGYSKEETIGKHFTKLPFLRLSEIPKYLKIFNGILRNKKSIYLELSWIKKDGSSHIGNITIDVIKRENKPVGFQAIIRDITERKIAEEKLNGIHKLSKELALTNDIDTIAEKTVEVMKNALNFDTAFFILREGNELKAIVSLGLLEHDKIVFDINSKKGIVPFVAREGRTYLTNNTKKDKLFINFFGQNIPNSELCVPIKIGDEVLGILNTESQNRDEYTKEDVEMLETLASEVAVAVAYSKSLNRIQDELNWRKQIEIALRKSEEKYKELVENANSIIAKFDKESRIISMNEYGLEFFGYKEEEIIGKTWTETILPQIDSNGRDLQNLALDIFSSPLKHGVSINENIKKNGEKVWIHWTNKPIEDENGNLTAILSVGSDYTKTKKAEEDLKDSEEKFRIFFEKANDAILIFNSKDEIIDSNETATRIFGYTKEEFLSLKLPDIQAPEVRGIPGTVIKSEFELHKDRIFESIDIDKYGNKIPVEVSTSKIRLKGEDLAVGVIRDIRERKVFEEKIKESENTLSGIITAAPIGINLFKDRIWIWSNKGMEKITGYKINELLNKSPRFLYESEEEYERAGRILYKTPREKDIVELETNFVTKSGEIKSVYIINSPLDNNDFSKGFITLVLDMTDRRKAEKQLEENLEYFAHLVDQIRNPLAILSGFTQVEIQNEKTRARILRQVERIEELIKKLDQGWMDTEETRKFLEKYR